MFSIAFGSLLLNSKLDPIHQLVKDSRRPETDETCRQILRWLSTDDFEETHERYYGQRAKNTGQWLLNDPRFIDWRDTAQSSLLWCYGAGKW